MGKKLERMKIVKITLFMSQKDDYRLHNTVVIIAGTLNFKFSHKTSLTIPLTKKCLTCCLRKSLAIPYWGPTAVSSETSSLTISFNVVAILS